MVSVDAGAKKAPRRRYCFLGNSLYKGEIFGLIREFGITCYPFQMAI